MNEDLIYEKNINAEAIKRMEKAKALVDKALGLAEQNTMPPEISECLKEASGMLIFKRHGRIEDGKMDSVVARALAKAEETGEPCILAMAPGSPVIVMRRRLFEKDPPFGLGPGDIIYDTERGHLGSNWMSRCLDCGETTPIPDQSPRE